MGAGAGMEVGQQEATFASNTIAQTTQGMIGLLKEASREKKRSVTVEEQEERAVPNTEGQAKKPVVNGIVIARMYEQAESRKQFLEKLLQLNEVRDNHRAMNCIRMILSRIHRYAHLYHVARAKGILAELIHGKDGVRQIPECWEDTPEFASEMRNLWKVLGIDTEVFLDPENLRGYDELSEALKEKGFSEEDLAHITLQDGEFVLARETEDQDNSGKADHDAEEQVRYVVFTPERYEQYLTFVQEREEERKVKIERENREAEKENREQPVMVATVLEEPLMVLREIEATGDIIVDANHRELQAFLRHEREARQQKEPAAPAKEHSEWLSEFVHRTNDAIQQDIQKKREEEQKQQAGQQPQAAPAPAPVIPDPAILNLGPGIGR